MVRVVSKTYTRNIYRIMSREEVQGLFKRAHEACRNQIKPMRHEIGGTFGGSKRRVIARPRGEYIACIKRFIDEEVNRRLGGA